MSNVTAEVLAGLLGKEHELYLPPGFGAWMEAALAPDGDFAAFGPDAVFLVLDRSRSVVEDSCIAAAKRALAERFPGTPVVVPDIEDVFLEAREHDPEANPFDDRMWKLASMPWSLAGLRAIRDEVNRLAALMKCGRRKALALDFDNTLWNGVVGEDGPDGVAPFAEFQRGVKAIKDTGVLLVGLSANNPGDVEPMWSDGRMVLGREDFADLRVGWGDKAANLESSARDLNIGTDSFVFVDDNPAERERMRALHPEVAVPEFPVTARRLARLHFPEVSATREDGMRTEMYRAEAARREFGAGLSVDEYLVGLRIWTDVHRMTGDEIPRVAQLSQRTNQFNVLTNRYAESDLWRFASDRSRLILTLHAGDRFGDQGLVAFVHARIQGDAAEIVDWVMSCRAMNRRVEFTLESALEDALRARGVSSLGASWRGTAKNAPVRDLFERFGFSLLSSDEDGRVKTYRKRL